jgi:hypothetical protein
MTKGLLTHAPPRGAEYSRHHYCFFGNLGQRGHGDLTTGLGSAT